MLRLQGPRSRDRVEQAVSCLRRGGLVVIPTDTVYGLAADPRVPGAEERIARAKGRPEGKPIPLLTTGLAAVEAFGAVLGAGERRLAEAFWPGPLTLVLAVPDRPGRPGSGPGAGRTEGFRVPDCRTALAVIEGAGGVLRATSANRSGEAPALTARQAADALGPEVDLVLDAGPAPGGTPSTVARLRGDNVEVLREGAIPTEQLVATLKGAGKTRPG
jgi:L-threonylcarbamoyladenylate synthase